MAAQIEVDLIKFLGEMDLDSPLVVVPKGRHVNARNVEWRGIKGDMVAYNLPGTTLIWDSLPSGNNVCIGRYFDQVNNQVFFCNYNSNGNHGIYILNVPLGTVQTLIQNGINTQGDILGFDPNVTISSMDLIYGDANAGNLFLWLDSLGRPSKCNVQRYLANTYNPIKRSYLDLAKAPPRMAPKVCYENDPTVTNNQLSNNLFQFRCVWQYDDYETAVFSQPSNIPLPNQSDEQAINNDPTQNCRISVWMPTGDADVRAVQLWVQVTSDASKSDWQLIYSFEKAVMAIPDNSIYRYLFYNNTVFTSGDPAVIDQIQDYVPEAAKAGKVINGNVPSYGNITEGYGPPQLNVSLSTQNIIPPADNFNGILFFAAQGGLDSDGPGNQIILYLTGAGTNDGSGNPTTLPAMVRTWIVDCGDSNGVSKKFQYDNDTETNITNILNGLKASAVTNGFTVVSQGTNSLTLSYTGSSGEGIVLYSTSNIKNSTYVQNQAEFAYPHQDLEMWAMVYFDAKGRTPGAFIFPGNILNTLPDLTGNTIPLNQMTINHRPPIWARYWAPARGLQSANSLFWICNQTFVNTDLNTGIQYAYVGISNMQTYNQDIEAADPVVRYDFAPGDRIQFMAQYPVATTNPPPNPPPSNQLQIQNDYAIVSVEDAPILNGIIQPGSFIKIVYPTADIGPNFNFGSALGLTQAQTDNFQRYYIRIYGTVKLASGTTTEEYFEFARLYAIGNHGTANAFHIANAQTQTDDLSQPAIVTTSDGNFFKRHRNVPTGINYQIDVLTCAVSAHSQVFEMPATDNNSAGVPGVVDNTQYQIQQQVQNGVNFGPGQFPQYSPTNADQAIFWNKLSIPQTLRLSGQITFNSTISGTLFCALYFMNSMNVPPTQLQYLIKNFNATEPDDGTALTPYTDNVDVQIAIPPNTQAWLFYGFLPSQDENFTLVVAGYKLNFQVINPINIPIIESSFNDQYNIITNPNGRPFIYDENAGTFTYLTRWRYGQAYQQGTSINNSNKFFPDNYDEFVNGWGGIVRLLTDWNKNLIVCQERRIGVVGVYSKFITNQEGQSQLVVSNDIITQNNIQYYAKPFGLSNQPNAIASFEYAIYGVDCLTGIIWRLSQDGLTPLSQNYRVQTWSGNNMPSYLNAQPGSYTPGGTAKILGAFHTKKHTYHEYILVAQQGIGVNGDTLLFDEDNNAFTGYADYNPDMIICAGNTLISWKNGAIYYHNNTTTGNYSSYYGINYYPSVSMIFNDKTELIRKFNAMAYDSLAVWEAFNIGDISTSYFNQFTGLQQLSQLIAQDFNIEEGRFFAALLRDYNSGQNGMTALFNGDFLLGQYLLAKLTYRGNNSNFIHNPRITWDISNKTF